MRQIHYLFYYYRVEKRPRDKNKNKPKHKQSNFCLYKSALHLTPQSKFWEE